MRKMDPRIERKGHQAQRKYRRVRAIATMPFITASGIVVLCLLSVQVASFSPAPQHRPQPFPGPLTRRPLPDEGASVTFLPASRNDLRERTSIATSDDAAPTKLMDPLADLSAEASSVAASGDAGWSYGEFAKQYPNVNNVSIATVKTASADLLAQVAIAHTPVSDVDWQRVLLFCAFGATYLGAFQYWYQVNVFKRLFDVDKFTSQPWEDKLRDAEGLKSLAAQTAVDLTVLTLVYLPTFYVFKAGVFSGSPDPSAWVSSGLDSYTTNFAKDEFDLIRVWAPADLVCFSVPLYLRLPVRHVVSFVWTAYLSFSRGGH